MSPSNGNKPDSTLATAVTEVSERVTVLIREEIELAKAEVTVKVKSLTRGIVWFGIAAGLAFFGVIFIPVTIAWLLDDLLVNGAGGLWEGFAIVMGAFLIGAGVCVFLGIRKMKVGSPAPKMAIEEAKKIRETVATAKPNGAAPSPALATPVAPVAETAAVKAEATATAKAEGDAAAEAEDAAAAKAEGDAAAKAEDAAAKTEGDTPPAASETPTAETVAVDPGS
ncbi:MAG TPA: phage holin family protein [Solirubrobacteraceae bacterium]|nr:phage holin family protein [Solirubrobacteraceae bacterium]